MGRESALRRRGAWAGRTSPGGGRCHRMPGRPGDLKRQWGRRAVPGKDRVGGEGPLRVRGRGRRVPPGATRCRRWAPRPRVGPPLRGPGPRGSIEERCGSDRARQGPCSHPTAVPTAQPWGLYRQSSPVLERAGGRGPGRVPPFPDTGIVEQFGPVRRPGRGQASGRSIRASHRPGAAISAGVGSSFSDAHSLASPCSPARSVMPRTNDRPSS